MEKVFDDFSSYSISLDELMNKLQKRFSEIENLIMDDKLNGIWNSNKTENKFFGEP